MRSVRLRHLVSLLGPYRGRVLLMLLAPARGHRRGALRPTAPARRSTRASASDTGALTIILALFVPAAVVNRAPPTSRRPDLVGRAARALQDLRIEVFAHLQRLSMSFYSRNKAGVIISRPHERRAGARPARDRGIATLFSSTLTLVGTAAILPLLDPGSR